MRILVVGPSITHAKGGMATVIKGIKTDVALNSAVDIIYYSSFINGPTPVRLFYSILKFFGFFFLCPTVQVVHLHLAAKGSLWRKMAYSTYAKLWGKRVILHLHGGAFKDYYSGLPPAKKTKIRTMFLKADEVIALSESWKDYLVEALGISHITVLNNAVNPVDFAAAITPFAQNHTSFLFLGHLCEKKGVYDLLHACAALNAEGVSFTCTLAGDGELEQCQQVVKENNLEDKIKFVGWINDAQKVTCLQNASTLVLPSYQEALPMSILEGMACGKVIISTTVGAIPEVVKPGINGVLLTPGDTIALCDALRWVCKGEALEFDLIAKNNIAEIEQTYNLPRQNKRLLEIYRASSAT